MQKGWRPPGAIFFLLRRRKNMERKTPLRAGAPVLRTHPLGGCRWRGWNSTGYQANLRVHPYPDSWCADRLPLRLRLRGCGGGLGDGVVGGFCVERSHAARRHAQRCGAPKAPLKGELAAARLTERWMQICCNLSVSASPSHLPFQGRLWTACGLFYPAEACFFPDLFLAVRPARLMQAARAATRAQPTRPETEVPAALSLPAKL